MMKVRVLLMALFGLFTSGCSSAQDVKDKMEMPEISHKDIILEYTGFTVSYNSKTLTPKWVAYELTGEELEGDIPRSGNFGMDMRYRGRQAMREDYANSGWDKGHMAPAADMKWNERAMKESFYLTNVCPQNHTLNGKSWHVLENKVRNWAQKYRHVYVVCGPIFKDGKYGKIGDREVQVPDAFYKALLLPLNGSYSGIAFIMDNDGVPHPLEESYLTIDELEEIIDVDLFANLAEKSEVDAESRITLKNWGI